jgi:hypothetical protein
MTNKLLHSTFLLLYFLIGPLSVKAQLQKLYLHPKPVGNENQSNYVDSIRFIPMEAKDGVTLGAYNNVQVTENHFLVVDFPNKNLLLYSRNGNFVKKINFKKQGDFYPSYREDINAIVFFGNNKNYALTSKDRIKIILDWDNPRNRKYFKKYIIDLKDPTFTIQKVTPDKFDVIGAYRYYDDYFRQSSISTSELYKDTLDYEIKLFKDNQFVKGFFAYNHVNEPKFLYTEQGVTFTPTDTSYINFLARPYCDTIYKMIRDSVFPVYKLVMPLENTLPASFFTTPFKSKTERDNFNRNNGWMFRQVYNCYETPRYIFMSIGYFSNFDSYVYNKKTNAFIRSRNIKPDSSQYNLSLIGDVVSRKNGKFYKVIKAGDLLTFFKQNKTVPVPKELATFLKTGPDAAAPVMVEFKLKN